MSAPVLWLLGRRLNRSAFDTPFDPATGQANPGVPGGKHTFFFIPIEYWGNIWPAIGMYKYFA
jgi:hypothetical protein